MQTSDLNAEFFGLVKSTLELEMTAEQKIEWIKEKLVNYENAKIQLQLEQKTRLQRLHYAEAGK